MSSAIEVLKKFRYTEEKVSVNQLHNALDVALLALERLDRLEKWLKDEIEKRDLDAENCFNENDALTESLIQRRIDVLKKVREVLEK